MKGLKKLKTDAAFVLIDMHSDYLNNKSNHWSNEKFAKRLWRIIDKASELKNCSCKPCGCNEFGKIYCEEHYL